MNYLVDTNVFSAVLGERPNTKVSDWLEHNRVQIYTSSITIAEIAFGIERLPAGGKRRRLEMGFEDLIISMGDRILRFDTRTARTWGKLQVDLERQARKMPLEDSYIAAVALRHNLTIATGNTVDFKRAGLTTVNPF